MVLLSAVVSISTYFLMLLYFDVDAVVIVPDSDEQKNIKILEERIVSLEKKINSLHLIALKTESENFEDSDASVLQSNQQIDESRNINIDRMSEIAALMGFELDNNEESIARLSKAGFSAYEAEIIYELENETKLKFLQAMSNPVAKDYNVNQQLLGEFGDAMLEKVGEYGYENYLKSRSQSTNVKLLRVNKNMSAGKSGLKAGDEIIRYDNKRVFSIYDLNRLSTQRSSNQSIMVEYMSEGVLKTASIQGGILGVYSRPPNVQALFGK